VYDDIIKTLRRRFFFRYLYNPDQHMKTPEIYVLHRYILALLLLKGFGNATVTYVLNYSISNNIPEDSRSMYKLIKEMSGNRRIRAACPSLQECSYALARADEIIHRSLSSGISMSSPYDSNFPSSLLSTVDEKGRKSIPLMIYYKGDLNVADRPSLAIVGTRTPTMQGENAAWYFAEKFASEGVNIVSGLAMGCDATAHRGALSARGVTTAVLAGGLDNILPKQNASLAQEILDCGGLLICENPVGSVVSAYDFVSRDRLQVALSNATLVIQSDVNGGTMHTANTSLAAGKPLWVVGYKDLDVPQVKGNHLLLSKGASELTSALYNADKQHYLSQLHSHQLILDL